MAEERTVETGSERTAGVSGTGDKKWSRQESEHLQEELLKKGESLLRDQKGVVANLLNGIANALDKSAPNFEEEGQPNTARYTRQAAQSIHGFARDLGERDIESIRRQVTDIARRQPGLIAGGAVALGFLASRFLRSSSGHEESQRLGGESEESLIVGTDTGFRAGTSGSSPIITEKEFKEKEKEFPK